jgi:hypothetical protein
MEKVACGELSNARHLFNMEYPEVRWQNDLNNMIKHLQAWAGLSAFSPVSKLTKYVSTLLKCCVDSTVCLFWTSDRLHFSWQSAKINHPLSHYSLLRARRYLQTKEVSSGTSHLTLRHHLPPWKTKSTSRSTL